MQLKITPCVTAADCAERFKVIADALAMFHEQSVELSYEENKEKNLNDARVAIQAMERLAEIEIYINRETHGQLQPH